MVHVTHELHEGGYAGILVGGYATESAKARGIFETHLRQHTLPLTTRLLPLYPNVCFHGTEVPGVGYPTRVISEILASMAGPISSNVIWLGARVRET